MDGEAVSACR